MAKQPKQRIVYTMGDIRDFLSTSVRQREIPKSLAPTEGKRQVRGADPQRQSSQPLERVLISGDENGDARWATRCAWLEDGAKKNEFITKR